jgi:3-hydroxyisobutyrate dehydrogenase
MDLLQSISPHLTGLDHDHVTPTIGFIGLGIMGQPMALNLARAGTRLVVWNRSPDRCEPLRAAGARVAANVAEVFAQTGTVILMLVNEEAIDRVLGRGTPDFGALVAEHVVVNMGSTAPAYSRALEADIHVVGGRYVEAPVSGSRKPAEAGQLVALLGGDEQTVAEVRPLLGPMCRETVMCGPVGNGLLMKLAVNLLLNTMIASLAEAVHFADRHGLDLRQFQAAINVGQMASDVTRVKIPKLVDRDFIAQAAMSDALNSCRLIAEAASGVHMATPLLNLARDLYQEAVTMGYGRLDMTAVVHAIEMRTEAALDDQSSSSLQPNTSNS